MCFFLFFIFFIDFEIKYRRLIDGYIHIWFSVQSLEFKNNKKEYEQKKLFIKKNSEIIILAQIVETLT